MHAASWARITHHTDPAAILQREHTLAGAFHASKTGVADRSAAWCHAQEAHRVTWAGGQLFACIRTSAARLHSIDTVQLTATVVTIVGHVLHSVQDRNGRGLNWTHHPGQAHSWRSQLRSRCRSGHRTALCPPRACLHGTRRAGWQSPRPVAGHCLSLCCTCYGRHPNNQLPAAVPTIVAAADSLGAVSPGRARNSTCAAVVRVS